METKFSNGKWDYTYYFPKNTDGDNTIDIIKYKHKYPKGLYTLTIAEIKTNIKCNYLHEEAEANAKLIAAAPDMFEVLKLAQAALELCRQHMRDNSNLNLWYGLSAPKKIEEVIKKATE